MVAVVTGGGGQLGQALAAVASEFPGVTMHFLTSDELDITSPASIEAAFAAYEPDFCINAAAYTAVDKAESEPEKARAINVDGAANMARACRDSGCILLHISTDFVFDGKASKPYTETDTPNPTGVYGRTKLEGEQAVAEILDAHFILRTSWVWSPFGHNFMKTMLRLASERDEVRVVNDQIGTPTHACDLARAILAIVNSGGTAYGIYHFSNEGQASWYDFARRIFEVNEIGVKLTPVASSEFPAPAKRPAYSVLGKDKIKSAFGLEIRRWEETVTPYP